MPSQHQAKEEYEEFLVRQFLDQQGVQCISFGEWGSLLENPQLTAAFANRLTSNSHLLNMKDCERLRGRIDE